MPLEGRRVRPSLLLPAPLLTQLVCCDVTKSGDTIYSSARPLTACCTFCPCKHSISQRQNLGTLLQLQAGDRLFLTCGAYGSDGDASLVEMMNKDLKGFNKSLLKTCIFYAKMPIMQ